MNFSHLVRVDREHRGQERHYVVRTHGPRFVLELTPDAHASGRVGKGVIKRLWVPNSWAGDYGQYSKLMTAAQEFFARAGRSVGQVARL